MIYHKGNVSDEGAQFHQETEPHDSNPLAVIVYVFGGGILCLVAVGIVVLLAG